MKVTKQAAFTLVEMMVAAVMFVIVMGLAFNTLLASNAVRQAATARIDIYQNGRSVLDVIGRELRSASLRKTDVLFSQIEKEPQPNPSYLLNNRGRLIINDWPPMKENSMGINTDDPRIYRGNGIDDDGDGLTDEEAFDGLDNDNDSREGARWNDSKEYTQGPKDPKTGYAMADGLDNDGNGLVDEGIDEDIFFPRDMINFMTLSDTGTGADLIEVGYAIDTRTGRDLLRRSAYPDPDYDSRPGRPSVPVDGIYPIAINYNMGQWGSSPDPNVPSGEGSLFAPWFDPVTPDNGKEATYGGQTYLPRNPPPQGNAIRQEVELVALDILGIDFQACYHDWVIEEAKADPAGYGSQVRIRGFTPAGSDPGKTFNPYSFPLRFWDSSVENASALPYEAPPKFSNNLPNVLPNGKDDLAVFAGTEENLKHGTDDKAMRDAAMEKTDGLPRLIEITIFVQDRNRYREDPIKLSTRVFLPFVTGDE